MCCSFSYLSCFSHEVNPFRLAFKARDGLKYCFNNCLLVAELRVFEFSLSILTDLIEILNNLFLFFLIYPFDLLKRC